MLKIFRLVLLTISFISAPNLLYADGKFYIPESIPLNIPYQRALLIYNGSQETLLLQSQYQIQPSRKPMPFLGWVVPVPTVPKLASMHPITAERMFERLWRISHPNVIRIWREGHLIIWGTIVLLLSVGILITLWIRKNHGKLFSQVAVISLLAVLAFIIILPHLAKSRGSNTPVEEIKAERVGVYDVQVVKGQSSSDLIQWLNDNKLHFARDDMQVFDQYIKRGWCFAVAKVRPEAIQNDEWAVASQGITTPLVLQFPTKQPIYPLALTATTNRETQIRLYVLSNKKVECDGRFKLLYANQRSHILDTHDDQTEPMNLFSKTDDLSYLTVFEGILTPEQMKQDAQLTFATDNESYRETVIRW